MLPCITYLAVVECRSLQHFHLTILEKQLMTYNGIIDNSLNNFDDL